MDINEKIEQLEKELAELKKIAKENDEPKFERVAVDEPYYYISLYNVLVIEEETENRVPFDNDMFELNNYFYTRERAEEVAEKIKMLLKLERLHDTFCPDYVPKWDGYDENKYYVYYNYNDELYNFNFSCKCKRNDVCFPSEEIAKKVCEILNAEKENEKWLITG